MAAVIEDVFVALEDAVREPVVANELPDVFDRVKFGRAGRERHQVDIAGDFEHRGGMPSRLFEHDEGMGSGFDGAGDFGKMDVQRLCIGPRYDEPGRLAFRRADGAEDIGWSLGADGRVPRFAHRRVILFFCPTRASSCHQTSTSTPLPSPARISFKRAGKFS